MQSLPPEFVNFAVLGMTTYKSDCFETENLQSNVITKSVNFYVYGIQYITIIFVVVYILGVCHCVCWY